MVYYHVIPRFQSKQFLSCGFPGSYTAQYFTSNLLSFSDRRSTRKLHPSHPPKKKQEYPHIYLWAHSIFKQKTAFFAGLKPPKPPVSKRKTYPHIDLWAGSLCKPQSPQFQNTPIQPSHSLLPSHCSSAKALSSMTRLRSRVASGFSSSSSNNPENNPDGCSHLSYFKSKGWWTCLFVTSMISL